MRLRSLFKKKPAAIVDEAPVCNHDWKGPHYILGDLGDPEPHPHPAFADKLQVRRQKFACVRVCFRCGTCEINFGYNEAPADGHPVPADGAPGAN